MNLESFYLCGHSFGAYLSLIYAQKHPERVDHLILADGWGLSSPRNLSEDEVKVRRTLRWRLLEFIYHNASPFFFSRALGTYGKKLFLRTATYISRRFYFLYDGKKIEDPVAHYLYHSNSKTPATGELAFRELSLPIARPKRSLEGKQAHFFFQFLLSTCLRYQTREN